jgi:hypothetical protein
VVKKTEYKNMQSVQDKYKVPPIETLQGMQISILKAIYKEGEKLLKYYNTTMSVFKHPELRVKTHDTKYYEEVMPIIAKVLREHEQLKKVKA